MHNTWLQTGSSRVMQPDVYYRNKKILKTTGVFIPELIIQQRKNVVILSSLLDQNVKQIKAKQNLNK